MAVVGCDESETACINQLLACSGREFTREKKVCVNNWDEVRSWKSVSPMGIYKKSKKKSMKTKRSQLILPQKIGNYSVTFSPCRNDVFPYRYRFSETGKMAHSSTNVLSYNSPSWRYIVDWKSYSYIERKEPGVQIPKVNNKSSATVVTRRQSFTDYSSSTTTTTTSGTDNGTDNGSDYFFSYRVNPSDVIDDKIASAYAESLSFDMDDYDEEELRQNLILRPVVNLPVASIDDNLHTVLSAEPKNVRKKHHRTNTLNLCIKPAAKPETKDNKKYGGRTGGGVAGGGRKKNRKKRRRDVIKFAKVELPPITPPKVEATKPREEFPFAIAQMLSSTPNNNSNFEKRLSRWKEIEARKAMTSSLVKESQPSEKSIDFYLPTLNYGNYIHLFEENHTISDVRKQNSDVTKQKYVSTKQISDVKLPKVGDNKNLQQVTTSTSSSDDSL